MLNIIGNFCFEGGDDSLDCSLRRKRREIVQANETKF